MEKLPSMYWIPKLHKNPIGERFIIASPECSIKPLLKDVTCILKLLQNNVSNYHDKRRVWTNVSNFWVIQNNRPVTERIDKINNAKKAKTVRTFDFSTLYTKIPHHLLKGALEDIVDFALMEETLMVSTFSMEKLFGEYQNVGTTERTLRKK